MFRFYFYLSFFLWILSFDSYGYLKFSGQTGYFNLFAETETCLRFEDQYITIDDLHQRHVKWKMNYS